MLLNCIHPIPLPLRHPLTVNAWLLEGEPLTLVDAGPADPAALAALERALGARALRLEDLELILATHHHVDHVGLAPAIRERSGAPIALLGRAAEYCASYRERALAERDYSRGVMAAHGVPARTIDADEPFWRFILDHAGDFEADRMLEDGDVVQAGGRALRVLDRPGHSGTDTLFVDDDNRIAFVGDHLLADISSNTENYPPEGAERRPHARVEYLENLRITAEMDLDRLLTGHGRQITAHAALVERRLSEHADRCNRILAMLRSGPRSAYALASGLWPPDVVTAQPLLVVWEVLGHLDILMAVGAAVEIVDGGEHRFALGAAPGPISVSPTRSEPLASVTCPAG